MAVQTNGHFLRFVNLVSSKFSSIVIASAKADYTGLAVRVMNLKPNGNLKQDQLVFVKVSEGGTSAIFLADLRVSLFFDVREALSL